jgi:ferredoxin
MNRREALKLLGSSISLAALSGIIPLTSCAVRNDRKRAKDRLVFFFTGTGNSLFIAKAFSDKPLSIPQERKKGPQAYKAEEIGFVFPDYSASAPISVRKFIQENKFEAEYIFSVITYGSFSCNVTDWWDEFAKGHGLKNDYINTIMMVDNYLPVFDMDEQMAMDKNTDENLAKILEDIGEREQYILPGDLGNFSKEMLAHMQERLFSSTADKLFQLDDKACTLCLKCTEVCPNNNYFLTSYKLQFAGSCEFCLACVQNCPQKALTLKSQFEGFPGERNPKARYRNPNITLDEIVLANHQ